MRKKLTNMQNIVCNICILLGILLILYYAFLTICYQYVAFASVLGLGGVILVLFGGIQKHFQIFPFASLGRTWQIILLSILSTAILIFTITEGIIIYYGHTRSHEKTDVILILGAGLNGKEISSTLKYRLDTAVEAHQKQPGIPIIVSGGQGPRESMSEAEAMANYLIQHGVPKSLILQEDKSTTTYENFQFSKKLLPADDALVLVITNNFHMVRAIMLAEKAGLNAYRYPSPAHFPTSFNFHVREFFGLMKDILVH